MLGHKPVRRFDRAKDTDSSTGKIRPLPSTHLCFVRPVFCQSAFLPVAVEMRDVVRAGGAQFGRDQQFDIAAPQRVIARDAKDFFGGAV